MTIDRPAIATDTGLLTDALRRGGALGAGSSVRAVTADAPRDMVLSRIVRLRLAYDGDAERAPASLILKARLPGRGPVEWGQNEVAFYRNVAPATPAGLVPRCFDTAWQAESKDWHLLLEDVGDTHRIATAWPLPPSDAECRAIVGALARFHAAWWDDARLGVSIGRWVDEEAGRQHLHRFQGQFRIFRDRLGDRLSPERLALYERFFASIPRLGQRLRARRNLTVVHGDAHVWNVFLPKDDGGDGDDGSTDASDKVLLFDWDAWRIGLATDDLAYMMATHWFPERRQRLERPMLDHYHRALLARGVAGYDRRALDDDYRRAVLWQMLTPVIQVAVNIPPGIWWNNLERILLAVDDLGCREMLD